MRAAAEQQFRLHRLHRLANEVRWIKRDLAQRLKETRRLFGRHVHPVDIHTHSIHSDGLGAVADNCEFAMKARLDFLFVTDHYSTGQKRALRRWANASWGQEPPASHHHLGLLCNSRLFKPKCDSIAADFGRAKKIAPFVWIPHPTGWYPDTWYTQDQINSLWTLGESFAMEVINGANKALRAYDKLDERTILVWDRLLCDGRKVAAIGGSDAHSPEDIGCTWTGVFSPSPTPGAIIKALNQNRCFASEATLMDFSCDGQPMGSTTTKAKNASVALNFRVADAAGLQSVRIISQGKVTKEIWARGEKLVQGTLERKCKPKPTYYRLESTAVDGRRAFSTPIYSVAR